MWSYQCKRNFIAFLRFHSVVTLELETRNSRDGPREDSGMLLQCQSLNLTLPTTPPLCLLPVTIQVYSQLMALTSSLRVPVQLRPLFPVQISILLAPLSTNLSGWYLPPNPVALIPLHPLARATNPSSAHA